MKRLSLILIVGILACSTAFGFWGKKKKTIRIGHKNYTEHRILGQMLAVMVRDARCRMQDARCRISACGICAVARMKERERQ